MFAGSFHYFLVIFIIFSGLIGIFINADRTKKLISLGIMQAAVIILYISLGFIKNTSPPIFDNKSDIIMQHPLPHVLMLTAIVVGVSINALGLAIIIKIKKLNK